MSAELDLVLIFVIFSEKRFLWSHQIASQFFRFFRGRKVISHGQTESSQDRSRSKKRFWIYSLQKNHQNSTIKAYQPQFPSKSLKELIAFAWTQTVLQLPFYCFFFSFSFLLLILDGLTKVFWRTYDLLLRESLTKIRLVSLYTLKNVSIKIVP